MHMPANKFKIIRLDLNYFISKATPCKHTHTHVHLPERAARETAVK